MFRYLIQTAACLIAFVTFGGSLAAQNVNPDRNTVVATNGLLLRTAPYSGSEVITGVPFGETVDVFDPCDYGQMTATTIRNYYRYDEPGKRAEYFPQDVSGQWVRVKYGRDTGFVFDAYLTEYFTPPTVFDDDANEVEPELVLLTPGEDNHGAIYHPGKYNFYGVYDAGPGLLALRKAEVGYFTAALDFEAALLISARPARDLLFIVGSKAPLRPHTFKAEGFTKHSLIYSGYDGPDAPEVVSAPGLQLETPGVDTYAEGPSFSVVTDGGEIPLVPPFPYADAVEYTGSGDIDGDGAPDYRLRYVTGEASRTVVFLSSLGYRGTASGLVSNLCC
ncbi:SH3 domain-containing protein [Lewinella sp. 4G2]|uniref:SH3 domain-containing protein n=1 Tax=Lewinella sp. 4G2 TaxID=1803372 RepID=UPI0007B4BEF6|nr:SH3 domain-containing protein [Lewinella sp. 4G2]OAV43577.1 hypothetical protein A3850_003290 [Lewinella sp. 4G2]